MLKQAALAPEPETSMTEAALEASTPPMAAPPLPAVVSPESPDGIWPLSLPGSYTIPPDYSGGSPPGGSPPSRSPPKGVPISRVCHRVVIQNSGHAVHVEQPLALMEAIMRSMGGVQIHTELL
jgi:pimeloyl-ACP methyl ester carboxylesterase